MRHLIWAALLLPSLAIAQTVTPANLSGTITLGGTSQVIASVNPSRHGCFVQNISSGDLWLNDIGGAAVANQPSIWLPPGAVYTCADGAGRSTGAQLSMLGGTTSQAFVAREW